MSKEVFDKVAENANLAEEEVAKVEERIRLSSPAIYEIVRLEGEQELERSPRSLWWSGVTAGISIGLSVVGMGLMRAYLPDAPWRIFLEAFGYSLGFVVVVMGNQQLFTEDTITAVLPVLAHPSRKAFARMAQLWGIVFAANMAGCLVFALFALHSPGLPEALDAAMLEIARKLLEASWRAMLVKGVVSGFLIAAMVWIMPSAAGQEMFIIILLTGLIGALEATHIVTGSAEALLLVLNGELGPLDMVWRLTVPVLLGNIIGGAALFTLLAYGQVVDEIETEGAAMRVADRRHERERREAS